MAVSVTVGEAEVVALFDGRHPFNLRWHYPSIDDAGWAPYIADSPKTLNFGAFLIRHAGRTVLIDTGWGPQFEPPGGLERPASLMDELASVGVSPEDVDVVALSHLHPDHIGWNLVERDGKMVPRFPRAPYLVPQADFDHYRERVDNGERIHPSIIEQGLGLADAGPMEWLADGQEVIPGLKAIAAPGHTPGHTIFSLESAGETFMLLADVAHHPAVLNETAWVQSFDWVPEEARVHRERILDEVESNGWLSGAGHFPYPSLGRLKRDAEGRRVWIPEVVDA